MSGTCPVCEREQDEGLLCHACTSTLEYELGDVAAIVDELEVTLSKQARMEAGGRGGLAHERDQMHNGASFAASCLTNTLTTWARDIIGDQWPTEAMVFRNRDSITSGPYCLQCRHRSCMTLRETRVAERPQAVIAAHMLLSEIPAIRRHPAVDELADQIRYAVQQARSAADRAANRTIVPVGPCPELDEEGAPCPGQVYAYFPTEDERPPRMECRADHEHRWTSIQWLRTGKRILDRIAEEKRHERLFRAIYGQTA